MHQAPVLTEADFRKISKLVKMHFGISLGPQKRSLVLARLQKRVFTLGFHRFADYLRYVKNDASGKELSILGNRIATNHTYFNRESNHFDFLRQTAVPYWQERLKSGEKIRIWSVGCSSGEEAYQIAMILVDIFGQKEAKNRSAILATDISRDVLLKAGQGRFAAEDVRHLKTEWIQKYFTQINPDVYQVKDMLKELILFRRLNLMRPQFPFKRKFHIIFCRNVMIYFDEPTRNKLINKFHRYLMPEGFLFIGHAECLDHNNPHFKFVRPSIYVHGGES